MKKKDLVPPLVPLLPCWSVVLAASETGVSTKTGISDGSVLMDQRWLQLVNKLLPALKAGNPKEKTWNFDYPGAAKMFNTATERHDHVRNASQRSQHRSGARFQQRRGQWKAFSSVARYDKISRLATDYHSLPRPLRDKLKHTHATCRGIVD